MDSKEPLPPDPWEFTPIPVGDGGSSLSQDALQTLGKPSFTRFTNDTNVEC